MEKSSGMTSAPKRLPQVAEQVEALGNEIDVIAKEVAEMYERFSVVLRIEPPKEKDKACEADQAIVPLASAIRDMRYRLSRVSKDITEMKRACEL